MRNCWEIFTLVGFFGFGSAAAAGPSGTPSHVPASDGASVLLIHGGGGSAVTTYAEDGAFIRTMNEAHFGGKALVLDGGGPGGGYVASVNSNGVPKINRGSATLSGVEDPVEIPAAATRKNVGTALSVAASSGKNLTLILKGHGGEEIFGLWGGDELSRYGARRKVKPVLDRGDSVRWIEMGCHSISMFSPRYFDSSSQLMEQFPPRLCGFADASEDEMGWTLDEDNPDLEQTFREISPLTLAGFKKAYREKIYYRSRSALTSDLYLEVVARHLINKQSVSSSCSPDGSPLWSAGVLSQKNISAISLPLGPSQFQLDDKSSIEPRISSGKVRGLSDILTPGSLKKAEENFKEARACRALLDDILQQAQDFDPFNRVLTKLSEQERSRSPVSPPTPGFNEVDKNRQRSAKTRDLHTIRNSTLAADSRLTVSYMKTEAWQNWDSNIAKDKPCRGTLPSGADLSHSGRKKRWQEISDQGDRLYRAAQTERTAQYEVREKKIEEYLTGYFSGSPEDPLWKRYQDLKKCENEDLRK